MFKSWIQEIWTSFTKPWCEPGFVLYFIFVIIGFSGIGVFLSLYQYHNSNSWIYVAQNIMTYAVSISVPAALSIYLHVIPIQKHQVSHTIVTLAVLLIQIIATCFTFLRGSMIYAMLSVIIAWVYWVIANSTNRTLGDKSYSQTIKEEVEKHGTKWDN